ncbi:MAG TPA: hypothetical protein VE404_04165 [Verrucomicrobiae bacterium]|nr:hypothetical protein [Verrucomicrobiae bacterium]
MDSPLWHTPGDPVLYKAPRRVWGLAHRMLQLHFPPGVHKHRTIEGMNAMQEAWDDANFTAYHERRQRELAELEGRS